MVATILIAEDEADVATLLRYNLEAEGFHILTAATGEEAAELIQNAVPDLLILDWMMPDLSGIELCRRLRAKPKTADMPIIMLTARGAEADRVRGLQTGADDYVTKPFSVSELTARVKALMRRSKPNLVATQLRAGDIELDRTSHRVYRADKELNLGPTEFRLLEHLMSNPGRVYSREQLLDHVWGAEVYVDERTVDVHVGRLRKIINRSRRPDPIRTVRGSGYAFDEKF